MCVCKRSRTTRSSIRMGWDHMVSETSTERFVFRTRTGPLCPVECSKIQLCGHLKKSEKSDWDGTCWCVWCVCNKLHTSHEPCVWGIVFAWQPSEKTVTRTPWETRNNDFDGGFSCLWCVLTKVHMSHQTCVNVSFLDDNRLLISLIFSLQDKTYEWGSVWWETTN